ncbi:MAG: hypothetical protein AAF850_07880 [Pseudomonadota bacterium]
MRILAALLCTLILASCVTAQAPLADQKANYGSLDYVFVRPAEKISIIIPSYDASSAIAPVAGAGGFAGGLFGALIVSGIEASQRARARRALEPLQEALGEIDLTAAIQSEIQKELEAVDWLDLGGEPVVVSVDNDEQIKSLKSSTQKDGVLIIETLNFLTGNGEVLVFLATGNISPKPTSEIASGRTTAPKPTFTTTVAYEVSATVDGPKRSDFLSFWEKDDAEAVRAAGAAAAPIVANLMRRQLSDGNLELATVTEGGPNRRSINLSGASLQTRVDVLEQSDAGELVRTEDGSLVFIAERIPPLPEIDEPTTPEGPIDPSSDTLIPVSAVQEDPLAPFRMAPIGNDAGLPGRFDKISQ